MKERTITNLSKHHDGTTPMTQNAWCRSSTGFSLIEILIVVVLIAVLAAIAVPSMRALLPRYQLRGVVGELVSAMQLGRLRAASTGNVFYIDFNYNNEGVSNGFYVCYLDLNGNGAPDASEFEASQVAPNAEHSGVPVVRMPRSVRYGVDPSVTSPADSSDSVGDGVAVNINGTKRIEFYPNGHATLNNSGNLPTIYLYNNRGQSRAVQVNLLGRVEVWKWADSGWRS